MGLVVKIHPSASAEKNIDLIWRMKKTKTTQTQSWRCLTWRTLTYQCNNWGTLILKKIKLLYMLNLVFMQLQSSLFFSFNFILFWHKFQKNNSNQYSSLPWDLFSPLTAAWYTIFSRLRQKERLFLSTVA